MTSATEHRKIFGGAFFIIVIIFLVLDAYFVDFESTKAIFENVKVEKNRVNSYVKSLMVGFQNFPNETKQQEARMPSK